MIKYKTVTKPVFEKDSIVCDMCGKEYSYDMSLGQSEYIEAYEFVHIHHVGGYSSIFGDGDLGDKEGIIDVDICQHCFKKLIVNKIKNKT
jgi:hypothetical protein